MSQSAYRTPPDVPPPIVIKVTPQLQDWLNILLHVVRGAMQGNLNVGGQSVLTLTPGATTTTINDPRIGGTSIILLQPKTANAAAALATTWFNAPTKTQIVANHVNAATVDRTFEFVIVG